MAVLAGSVFKLAPSGGGWTYADLHDFCFWLLHGSAEISDGHFGTGPSRKSLMAPHPKVVQPLVLPGRSRRN